MILPITEPCTGLADCPVCKAENATFTCDRVAASVLERRNAERVSLRAWLNQKLEAALRSCLYSCIEAVKPTQDRNAATPAMHKAIETTHETLKPTLQKRDAAVKGDAIKAVFRGLHASGEREAAQLVRDMFPEAFR